MAIENGKYRAKAKEWSLGEAATGTPQVGICFELLDQNETITYYGFLTDNALQYTIKNMRICGWQGADLERLDGLNRNEVVLVIENQTYNGKTSPKVIFINSPGGLVMGNQMQGDAKKSFAANMKAKILALDPTSASKHASVDSSKKYGDDIPF